MCPLPGVNIIYLSVYYSSIYDAQNSIKKTKKQKTDTYKHKPGKNNKLSRNKTMNRKDIEFTQIMDVKMIMNWLLKTKQTKTINDGENVKQLEPLYDTSGNVKCSSL